MTADDTLAAPHASEDRIDAEASRPLVAAARHWIERHYTRPLTVARIARHVGLPALRLEREFSAVYGESPRDLLTRCRMQAAERLKQEGRTQTEIAVLVGYNTERLFLNDYRRWKHLLLQRAAALR